MEDQEISKSEQYRLYFDALAKMATRNLESSSSGKTTAFQLYSKENLLKYLQAPQSYEKALRNASIYMYNTSSHYRRLINFYADLPAWSYILLPLNYSPKTSRKTLESQYEKAWREVENMNLKHELQKASVISYREGVLYGAVWKSKSSFFIQRIDPDICVLSSIVDGTWMYAVDFSQIKKEDLFQYPPEFTALWEEYNRTGVKYQEIPSDISFCLKADETTSNYSLPYWAAVLPSLHDIESYKELQETASEIDNYKLLTMKIPVDKDGNPELDFELAKTYYNHVCANLPQFVGAAMTPMEIQDINFERSGAANQIDEVERAVAQFWEDSGTSSLLFGSQKNTSSSALRLSITADEAIAFAMMNQCERLINRILKSMSGKIKFKINILPVTIYNRADMIKLYKEASTFGIPVKSSYAAALGINGGDVPGMNDVELGVLHMDELVPLSSSYNTSSDDVGRPSNEEAGEPLTDEGEASKEGDKNDI